MTEQEQAKPVYVYTTVYVYVVLYYGERNEDHGRRDATGDGRKNKKRDEQRESIEKQFHSNHHSNKFGTSRIPIGNKQFCQKVSIRSLSLY